MSSTTRSQHLPSLTVADILALLRRQLRYFLLFPALFLLLGGAYLAVAHRYYLSSSEIEIDASNKTVNLSSQSATNSVGDALAVNNLLQTQAQILQSEALALRVVQDLDLEQDPVFRTAAVGGGALETSPSRVDHVLAVFRGHLSVQVVPNTHLIAISFTDRDPNRAAQVVNRLVQGLIDFNFQTRYKSTLTASNGLNDQLAGLRKRSEDLQTKLLNMQQQAGVLSSNMVDGGGHPLNYSPALDRVRNASDFLLQAQTNVILKRAIADVAKAGNAEQISNLSGTALSSASPGVSNSLTVIQGLRAQEATLQQQVDEARTKYGPRFPRLIELDSSLATVRRSIQDETKRIDERAENDLRIAEASEGADRRIYEDARKQAIDSNGKAAEYDLLRQDVDQSRKLYNDLLGHLQEAGVLQGLHTSDIIVVDPARPVSHPVKPRPSIILAGALGAGLFLALLAAFGVEVVSDKITSPRALVAESDGAFALLPEYRQRTPSQQFAEAVRALRAKLIGSRRSSQARVVLVTSSIPDEGKSVVALELAKSLAQVRRTVLLVETNFRRPALNEKLSLHTSKGLSELLVQPAAEVQPVRVDGLPDLHVLAAGVSAGSSSDLLESPEMQKLVTGWRHRFDYVLLDAAPVLASSDALSLAPLVDYTLLVARENRVSRMQLRSALEALESVTPRTNVGTVLNATQQDLFAYDAHTA